MGKTHPAIVLALHFHKASSLHPPCTVFPWNDSPSCSQLLHLPAGKENSKRCLVSTTSLGDEANELNTPAQRVPCQPEPKVAPETPVPTEQCSTQITRWPHYVAVITTDIPALHKPRLSCRAMLRDYLNKNVSHGDSSPWLTPCWGQKKRSGDAVNLWKDVREAQLRTGK